VMPEKRQSHSPGRRRYIMNVLIVYDSQFGNTERLARAIAEQLGSVRLMRAEGCFY